MAANKDIELIIRARNEASKAIDAVNKALEDLAKSQDAASKSAQKTDTILGQLGTELETLKARAAGLGSFQTIVEQLTLAGDAAKRMGADLERSVADLAKLKSASEAAAVTTARLVAEAKAASQAYIAQKNSVSAAKNALTQINAEVRRAETTYASLGKQVAALKEPNAALTGQYVAQKAALDTLRAKQAELKASLDQQRASLKSAAQAHTELGTALKASAQNQSKLESAAKSAAASLEREKVSVTESNAALAQVQGAATQASTALGGVVTTEKAVSAASVRAAADLNAVAAAMERQRTLRSPAAVDQGPAAAATAAYRAHAAAVATAREQLELLRAITTELGRAMSQTATPTATLSNQFLLARAASAEAQTAYIGQAAALNQLRGAAQGGFAAFAAAEQKLSAGVAPIKQSITLAETFRRSLIQLTAALNGTGNASRQAGGGVGIFQRALAGSNAETRTSLGLLQRIRGQVLALAAGYAGLIGAIQGIGTVINTIRTVEAAQNRLGAIFGQSQEKVIGEMRFLEFQADRLGIQFGVLSDQYTQFAVAANQANFSAEATREIFLAVAEAGRVNKLSIENLQGVFLALQQMISKGKVSSEELRRQMGDRLPGAFNIFAKSMGVSTQQLNNLLQAGQVFSDQSTLLNFARQLNKEFGSQLPQSLESITTALGRFQNNLFNVSRLVAAGGFAEGLKSFLQAMNEFFKSEDGKKFFLEVGAGLKTLLGVMTALVNNIDLVALAFKALIAFKIASFFSSLFIEITKLTPAFKALAVAEQNFLGANKIMAAGISAAGLATVNFGKSIAALPTRVGVALTSVGGFRAGLVGLARGGFDIATKAVGVFRLALNALPGLFFAIVASIAIQQFISWATAVEDSTNAMQEHEDVMTKVIEVQDLLKNKTDSLSQSLKNLTLIQLKKVFLDVLDTIFALQNELKAFDTQLATGPNLSRTEEETNALNALLQRYKDGKIDIKEFQTELGNLARSMTTRDAIALASQLEVLSQKIIDAKNAANEEVKAGKAWGENLTALIPITGATAESVAAVGTATATTAANMDGATISADNFKNKNDELAQSSQNAASETESAWSGIVNGITNAVSNIGALLDNLVPKNIWGTFLTSALGAFVPIANAIRELIELMHALESAARAAIAAATAAKAAAPPAGGHARGGMIRGPGTGSSDSIPAWLSSGEFVVNAKAVKKYGAAIFSLLNDMRLPPSALRKMISGFAMGGPVSFDIGSALSGKTSTLASDGPIMGRYALDLSIGNQRIGTVMAPREVADKLVRFALTEQVKSGGRKPSWYLG